MPNEFPGRSATGSEWLAARFVRQCTPSRRVRERGRNGSTGVRLLAIPLGPGSRFRLVCTRCATSQGGGKRTARGAVTGLAGLAALAIALAFPAAYLLSANNRLMGVIEVRAQIYGDQVTDTASQHPELWNAFFGDAKVDLTGLAIAAADDAQAAGYAPERRRVFAGNGHMLLDVGAAAAARMADSVVANPRCGRTITVWAMSRLLVRCGRNS